MDSGPRPPELAGPRLLCTAVNHNQSAVNPSSPGVKSREGATSCSGSSSSAVSAICSYRDQLVKIFRYQDSEGNNIFIYPYLKIIPRGQFLFVSLLNTSLLVIGIMTSLKTGSFSRILTG